MDSVATWIRQDLEGLKEDPEYLTQGLLLEVNEQICEFMDDQGVSRADLARRLGWRRSAVTKMLQGNHNISIGRLMRVALALGCKLTAPQFEPLVSKLQLKVQMGSDDNTSQFTSAVIHTGVSFQPLTPQVS